MGFFLSGVCVMLFFFFLFFSCFLSAESFDSESIISIENEPSALVAGRVNAITGKWNPSECDLIIQGAEPIVIRRTFDSSNKGWSIFPTLKVVETRSYKKEHTYTVTESSGAQIDYRFTGEKEYRGPDKYRKYIPINLDKGYTNTSRGEISSRFNLRNQALWVGPKEKRLILHCADGTVRYYKKIDEFSSYILIREQLPNGNWIAYDYSQDKLKAIRSLNPDQTVEYARATITYKPHKQRGWGYIIDGSDGQSIRYKNKNGLLTVFSSQKPDLCAQAFAFDQWIDCKGIRSISQPLNRSIQADYYQFDATTVCGEKVVMHNTTRQHTDYMENREYEYIVPDPRCGRVKTLACSMGTDPQPQITHSFLYDLENRVTTVIDGDNLKTEYRWDGNFRLIEIKRFDQLSQLRSTQRFVWSRQGDLLEKQLLDGEGTLLNATEYVYCDRGNVLIERLRGNLSGQGIETYEKRFTYFPGPLSLLRSVEEDNGTKIEYTYLGDSDLLTSQSISERGILKEQTLWSYDSNRLLIREEKRKGDYRFIRQITPKPEAPYLGLPWIIEEKCGPDEQLIQKSVIHYTRGARIAQKDLYDSEGICRYSLHYKYDEKGRLIEQTDPIGRVETTDYDLCGNRILHKPFNGRVEIHFEYDYANQKTRVWQRGDDGVVLEERYRYDHKNRLLDEEKPFGYIATYSYDAWGALAKKTLPLLGHTFLYTCDCKGRIISETDPDGQTKKIAYNAYDQPIRIDFPDGGVERNTYYLNGWLKTAIGPDGAETTYAYNYLKQPVSKTLSFQQEILAQETFEYRNGFLSAKIDAENNRTVFTYHPTGQLASVSLGKEKTEYHYDALLRPYLEIKADLRTVKTYDLAGRVEEERQETPQQQVLKRIRTRYDPADHCIAITQVIDGQESTSTSLFDSASRLIAKTDPLGHTTRFIYEPTYLPTESIASKQVALLKETIIDPLGLQTINQYNGQQKIATCEISNAKGVLLDRQKYTYDFRGNVVSRSSEIFDPPRTVAIQYEYDVMGRLAQQIEAPQTSYAKKTIHRYDTKGRLCQTIKPDGVALNYTYTPLGLVSLLSSDGLIHYLYTLDRLGRNVSIHDQTSGQTTQKRYDPQGRVIQETIGTGYTVSSEYDHTGRRTLLTLPDSSSISYEYDPLYLRKVTRNEYSHSFTSYDEAGYLLEEQLAADLGPITYKYDLCGRKQSYQSAYWSDRILRRDPVGNVLETDRVSYQYDDLYQLRSEEGDFSHQYLTDAHYCLQQKDAITYPVNELLQEEGVPYDANGNPQCLDEMRLTFDPLDRLIAVETPHLQVTYAYDSDHRRLSRTVTDKTRISRTYFLYDGQTEIGEIGSNGWITELRIFEKGRTLAMELHGQMYAPIHDLNGHIWLLISAEAKQPVARYLYSAYAQESKLFSKPSPWQFADKRFDKETGFIYYGRRYYYPSRGQWINPDPAGFTDTWNLYAFVKNNPLRYQDHFGLYATDRASDAHFLDPHNATFSQEATINTLPEVHFNSVHEEIWAINYFKKRSGVYDLGLPEKSESHRILFINGIWNDFASCKRSAEYLSKLAGGYNIHFIHNASFGYGVDLAECADGLNFIATEPVRQMRIKLDELFENCPDEAHFLLIAHSQGAIHTRNFFLIAGEEESKRVRVAAFAPAAYVFPETCKSVAHYRAASWRHDIVPRIDKQGAIRAAETIIDLPWSTWNPSPLSAHPFQCEIYKKSIQDEIEKYYDIGF